MQHIGHGGEAREGTTDHASRRDTGVPDFGDSGSTAFPPPREEHFYQLTQPCFQNRQRPPDPYSNYANMIADIISHHPRRKVTAKQLYALLNLLFPKHFLDDNLKDYKGIASSSRWKVPSQLNELMIEFCSTFSFEEEMVREKRKRFRYR